MNTRVESESVVSLSGQAVSIHGESVILLCASLFYFRVPSELWKERLDQVKEAGYNCIDVYFPWNFHEPQEGKWDFNGMRDAEKFLQLASEAGLWVVARPGPYICSEWDGGALPSYLYAKEPFVRIRNNDPAFLQHVARWYAQILPILRRHEVTSGGSVILVQLENELDFYGCSDPAGYMAALRDMAVAHGLSVPLIACAGQGGLLQASGLTDGVVPTCNFYPDDQDPHFEKKVLHYRHVLHGMNYPLLVTETNRSHYLLRRLLSTGTKLLGPYLQVSGTNFGFTNAINNWGKPLAFLTSDYDFGGMISPEGHLRAEAQEAKLLARLIRAYGRAIAEAEPDSGGTWSVQGETEGVFGPYVLRLQGGGELIFVTNGEDRAKQINLLGGMGAHTSSTGALTLSASRSLALPVNVPLSLWGVPGQLIFSTAELYMAGQQNDGTVLAFHTEGNHGRIALAIEAVHAPLAQGMQVIRREGHIELLLTGEETAYCRFELKDGRRFTVIVTNRLKALHTETINLDGTMTATMFQPKLNNSDPSPALEWQFVSGEGWKPPLQAVSALTDEAKLDFLERLGIYRGYAWYEANVNLINADDQLRGLLIRQASDVVSLYADGTYLGTLTPGGASVFVPVDGRDAKKIQARVEIWGHSNFNDLRLPALCLPSLKGIGGVTAITAIHDITANWSVNPSGERLSPSAATKIDEALWPVVGFGSWLSADHPSQQVFRKKFVPTAKPSAWILHFRNLQGYAQLWVNGVEVGSIHPMDAFIDLKPYVTPGQELQLEVHLLRTMGQPGGEVVIYEGVEASTFTVAAAEEAELKAEADHRIASAAPGHLPLSLDSGKTGWLFAAINNSAQGKGWRVRAAGSGLKLTVFMDERIVGRLWLPGGTGRPTMTGGSTNSFYLPGPWFHDNQAQLSIYLEAADEQAPGKLESLEVISV
ncbi:beta-galactosidase [Paenibacillus sp. DXFW5]|uniref:Beta-galactosidase n=1 Tax=Paenibacillus rhizolycopersici TaxID=2780073 RepID=A0ABS2H8M8_9BACL|nr:beta-galactosidase [Paenibacillus rhizolycopersici]MBM6997777.1 beta-galactosidase [Paenibacillus rhizolycopersici]